MSRVAPKARRRRTPNLSANAPARGPRRPVRAKVSRSRNLRLERLQPNSLISDSSKTLIPPMSIPLLMKSAVIAQKAMTQP